MRVTSIITIISIIIIITIIIIIISSLHRYLNLNEENKTFKFEKRHVSATPVPSPVYGWNYNDEQYIAEITWNLPLETWHCEGFPLYIVHHCNSIRKLTMAQELPKHVFFQI